MLSGEDGEDGLDAICRILANMYREAGLAVREDDPGDRGWLLARFDDYWRCGAYDPLEVYEDVDRFAGFYSLALQPISQAELRALAEYWGRHLNKRAHPRPRPGITTPCPLPTGLKRHVNDLPG